MSHPIDRNAYCREQAAKCARAALEKTLTDVKEAYLNLEQGWLQLASDIGNDYPPSRSAGVRGGMHGPA